MDARSTASAADGGPIHAACHLMGGPDEPPVVVHATICNRRGLHARAAAKFVSAAERFSAVIEVEAHGQSVSAQSIMGLMMLGAGKGTTLELRGAGADVAEALAALVELVEAGFHEQD